MLSSNVVVGMVQAVAFCTISAANMTSFRSLRLAVIAAMHSANFLLGISCKNYIFCYYSNPPGKYSYI